MKLPNGDRAVVDVSKLRDYCLSDSHPRGRHKARVFRARLGMTADNAEELRETLLDAARATDASQLAEDKHGQRFMLESIIEGPGGSGTLRSLWIVRRTEDFPRLVTCYVF